LRFRIGFRLVASLLLGATVFTGAPLPAAAPQELGPSVDSIFAPWYAKAGSPGCALAVVRDGGIVYEKGYGLANVENGVAPSSTPSGC
jgi:CubicO group peptidase (beta-lactamase class C family)